MLLSWSVSVTFCALATSPHAERGGSSHRRHIAARRLFIAAGLAAPLAHAWPRVACASLAAKQAVIAKAKERASAELDAMTPSGGDPLTTKLARARDEFADGGARALEDQDWDALRKSVRALSPLLTFGGYTGESLKGRAEAWAAAGDVPKAKEILVRRNALARKLTALDTSLYAVQTSKKPLPSAAELSEALMGVIEALDGVLAYMGCEQRWKSGACEIIPLRRCVAGVCVNEREQAMTAVPTN